MIGLKGAPHGLHDDSLGWMKISTFEREETVHFLSTAGGDVLGAPRVARGLCEDVRPCNAPVASSQFW